MHRIKFSVAPCRFRHQVGKRFEAHFPVRSRAKNDGKRAFMVAEPAAITTAKTHGPPISVRHQVRERILLKSTPRCKVRTRPCHAVATQLEPQYTAATVLSDAVCLQKHALAISAKSLAPPRGRGSYLLAWKQLPPRVYATRLTYINNDDRASWCG